MELVSLRLIGLLGGDCGLHCCLVRLLCHGTSTWVDVCASLFAGITGHGRVYLSCLLEEGSNRFYVVSLSCACLCERYANPATEISCIGLCLIFVSSFRDLNFMIMDLPRHTHHSAWHSMHNVICGGAKYMDDYLESLIENKVKLYVIQGDRDQIVPMECSINIRRKVPSAEVTIVQNADHNSVILGREKDFTETLQKIWVSSADINRTGTG